MSKRDNITDFRKFLEQMFRLDGADGLQLDFGIYRVIRLREERIKSQLIDKLPEMADEVLAHFALQDSDNALIEFESAKARFLKAISRDALDANDNIINPTYANTPIGKEYLLAQKQAAHFVIESTQITNDIFNHLLQFFGRYYEGGDFMPRRCITNRGAYSLPYNGEDVMLHWANRGQYYVKTANRFLSYSFTLNNGGTIKIVVRDTDNLAENNNKGGKKLFFPQIKDAVLHGNTLEIPMEYRAEKKEDNLPKKNKEEYINTSAAAAAEKSLAKKLSQAAIDELFGVKDDKGRHAFFRYLEKYRRGSDSDFFIHKDLSGFLSGELDSYIKNDILDLKILAAGNHAAIAAQTAIARAVHKLGGNIIARLSELENFQKKLWEKKKFVLGTHYIVRLGAIDKKARKKLLPQIIACDKQWKEWEALGITAASKKTEREKILQKMPPLPLDTANFDEKFCDELIASFDNLEDAIDGVCFHSENWQALNLMAGKYAGQIDVCYIDPPYNTDSSAIIYKNNYKDSSWLSLMHDRMALSQGLLSDEGVLCCAIDDEEIWRLRGILDGIFPQHLGVAVVRSNPVGRKSTGHLSSSHEYAIFYGNDSAAPSYLLKSEGQLKRYPLSDDKGKYAWLTFIRQGSNDKREDSPTMFYPIYVGKDDSIRVPKMEWNEIKQEYDVMENPRKGESVVLPIIEESNNGGKVIEKNWQRGRLRVQESPDEYRIIRDNEKIRIDFKARMDEESMPQTWWGDNKYASSNHGAGLMKKLFASKPFDFPKALELVSDCLRASGANNKESVILDYFAGSGTTAHAVIALNRKDGGKRKFIIAEMGEYFDNVVLPRIKKVIYAPYWKNGKPAENGNGNNGNGLLPDEAADRAPRLVKYHRLESYEDTLENIEFDDKHKQLAMDGGERYMWEWESRNNITFAPSKKLLTPFDFKLKRAGKNKGMASADLPETFNLMSGMRLLSRRVVPNGKRRYQFDIGMLKGKETICVWRDMSDSWQKSDCAKDRDFINKECAKICEKFAEFSTADILTNGSAAGFNSIDPMFSELMFGREE